MSDQNPNESGLPAADLHAYMLDFDEPIRQ
jgi:hypothetical protein